MAVDPLEFARPVVAPVPDQAKPPRLALHYFADVTVFDQGGGLIDGILQPAALSVIYGESGSRKTFLALDIAMAIAQGIPWRDRGTMQAPVLYIACEAGRSFANRVAAYRIAHGLEDAEIAFAYIAEPLDLGGDGGDAAIVVERIREASARFEAPVGLVQVDTLSRAMNGGDENSPQDMGRLVANIDMIRAATGAHVQAVHHSGKDTSKGARGHSLLRAALDTEIEVIPDAASNLSVATVRKQRDLPTEGAFPFALDVVELGTGTSGRPITSCVVRHLEAGAAAAAKARKLTDRQRLAMDALRNTLANHGKPAPDATNYPGGAVVVTVDQWRDHMFSRGVLDRDAGNPRQEFKRLRDGLTERGAVAEWNGLIWITKP